MGWFLELFFVLSCFSGLFWCCFGTVQLLNSYCFARGVGRGVFRVRFVEWRVGTVWMVFPILSISCKWFWTFLETQDLAQCSFLHFTAHERWIS